MSAFKKLFWLTDIHFGRSGNSPQAIRDNLEFLKWAIDEARTWGAETCIFGGDWFDNRHQIGVIALNAALDGLDALSAGFDKVIFIPGNHDLPYRDRRDASSIEIGRNLTNVEIIRQPTKRDDVTFLPWLVGNEHKTTKGPFGRYVFGHLEVPGFLMNAKVEMPDGPDCIKADNFDDVDYAFTGHFHMRQSKGRVCYTGNVMPFNFNDAGDDNRGIMLLEWGQEPEFRSWPDQPRFRLAKLSQIIASPEKFVVPGITLRATVDVDLPYEEVQQVRDAIVAGMGARKIELIPKAREDHASEPEDTKSGEFQSVDQIVIDGLTAVESAGLDPARLVAIYRSLADVT